jgi:nuclear mRNA export protein SAC3
LEGGDDLYSTHAFIRDRTRSIRQDFTLQNSRGREAIDCHERIARYHILCLHALCVNPNFTEQQEMEQLRKVLQSLMEFYKDTKMSSSPLPLPNETEFRAYFALVFLRDPDVSQQLQTLPQNIFFSPPLMRSLRLRSWALRSNDKFVQNNAEAAPNSFVRFFKEIAASTTYLEACVLETWFGSIRAGALKALRQALGVKNPQVSQVSVAMLVQMLGFDSTEQFIAFCDYLSLEIIYDEETNEPKSVWFRKSIPWEGKMSSRLS